MTKRPLLILVVALALALGKTGFADDVLQLLNVIREKVFDKNQIHLESEVQIWH